MKLSRSAAELFKQGRFPIFPKSVYVEWKRDEVEGFYAQVVSLLCDTLGWLKPSEVLRRISLDKVIGQFQFYPSEVITVMLKTRENSRSFMSVAFNCDDSQAMIESIPGPFIYDRVREKYSQSAHFAEQNEEWRESFMALMVIEEFFRFSFLGKGIDQKLGTFSCPFRFVCKHADVRCRAMIWNQKRSSQCIFADFFRDTLQIDAEVFSIGMK